MIVHFVIHGTYGYPSPSSSEKASATLKRRFGGAGAPICSHMQLRLPYYLVPIVPYLSTLKLVV